LPLTVDRCCEQSRPIQRRRIHGSCALLRGRHRWYPLHDDCTSRLQPGAATPTNSGGVWPALELRRAQQLRSRRFLRAMRELLHDSTRGTSWLLWLFRDRSRRARVLWHFCTMRSVRIVRSLRDNNGRLGSARPSGLWARLRRPRRPRPQVPKGRSLRAPRVSPNPVSQATAARHLAALG